MELPVYVGSFSGETVLSYRRSLVHFRFGLCGGLSGMWGDARRLILELVRELIFL